MKLKELFSTSLNEVLAGKIQFCFVGEEEMDFFQYEGRKQNLDVYTADEANIKRYCGSNEQLLAEITGGYREEDNLEGIKQFKEAVLDGTVDVLSTIPRVFTYKPAIEDISGPRNVTILFTVEQNY